MASPTSAEDAQLKGSQNERVSVTNFFAPIIFII
jgi:hypothetical protein